MTILRTCFLLLILSVVGLVALGQQDDVVRINTELVQTGVAVVDKQGQPTGSSRTQGRAGLWPAIGSDA